MAEEQREEEIIEEFMQEEDDDLWQDSWSWRGTSSWIWGIGLILLGGVFLMQNITGYSLIRWWNWWAIFLIVPGVNMLVRSWNGYRTFGKFTAHGRRSSFWGLVLTALGISFLLNIDMGVVWPIFLIIGGLYLLLWRG